jgi:uncharacterized protein YrrD
MLRNLQDLHKFSIRASDGDIGHVTDFYFDDQAWVVRYLVVETGSWLSSRKVLISPMSLGPPDWQGKSFPVSLTRAQVENSPDIDTDKPVSRQHEQEFLRHYSYPFYWIGTGLWGDQAHPTQVMPEFVSTPSVVLPQADSVLADPPEPSQDPDDSHLRSGNVVSGYRLHADDGEIGNVQDLMVDDETWAVRYLVVSTSYWQTGHQALVTPESIAGIDWFDGIVLLNLAAARIQDTPSHDPGVLVDRAHEKRIHSHYGIRPYWLKEPALADPDPMLAE